MDDYRPARRARSGPTCWPQTHPRPKYPPFREILWPAVVRVIRFPMLTTIFALLTMPLYRMLEQATFWRVWFLLISDSLSAWGVGVPFWVVPEDLLFTIALTTAVGTVSGIATVFFKLCDRLGVLKQYRMPRTKAQLPSDKLESRALRLYLLKHLATVRSVNV